MYFDTKKTINTLVSTSLSSPRVAGSRSSPPLLKAEDLLLVLGFASSAGGTVPSAVGGTCSTTRKRSSTHALIGSPAKKGLRPPDVGDSLAPGWPSEEKIPDGKVEASLKKDGGAWTDHTAL